MDEWENWETVSIESELDKLRDEREKKENLELSATATGTNSGCARILIGLLIGLTVLTTICLLLIK
jgi:hypothetical protein